MNRTLKWAVMLCVALAVVGARSAQATTLLPGQVLSVSFDIATMPGGVNPLNLVFLEFRGGATLAPGTTATAILFVDGSALGSTNGDTSWCSGWCSSEAWEFASPGFPSGTMFQDPTTVDLSPLVVGSHALVTLTVDSGYLEFGLAPYTENAPIVVLDSIAGCGPGCTAIYAPTVTLAPNPPPDGPPEPTWQITPVPEPTSLPLVGSGVVGLLLAVWRNRKK